jgi:hypothetical protein
MKGARSSNRDCFLAFRYDLLHLGVELQVLRESLLDLRWDLVDFGWDLLALGWEQCQRIFSYVCTLGNEDGVVR